MGGQIQTELYFITNKILWNTAEWSGFKLGRGSLVHLSHEQCIYALAREGTL